ncbi:hypothetical protein ACSRUE_15555 [Sorangium sp. KYC3313]|uniref:hypothetical protein n=1 Tax=unclassified Sorangium TaxID=2621164 RepID=UPI003F641E2D
MLIVTGATLALAFAAGLAAGRIGRGTRMGGQLDVQARQLDIQPREFNFYT